MDIVHTYGHLGPHGGDELVADLLQRTVDGQWSARKALDATTAIYASKATPLMLTELPLMAVMYAQQLANIRWEMATAFLDGVVMMYRDAETLPKPVYAAGDALCDYARGVTRQSVQAQASWKDGGKVRLVSLDVLEDFVVNDGQFEGIWNVFEVVVAKANTAVAFVTAQHQPERFKSLIESELRLARPHLETFRLLQTEWRATRFVENKLEVIQEATTHVRALYELMQHFWAPYLYGAKYSTLLKQKASLSDVPVRDPWILTDPQQRNAKEREVESCQELADFWLSLENSDSVFELGEQIRQLLKQRVLRRRTGRGYPVAPWSSQYLVRAPFAIGSAMFTSGDLVAFYASSDPSGRINVQVRRTGKLTHIIDMLGAR